MEDANGRSSYEPSNLPEPVPRTPVADRSPKYFHQPAPDDTPKYQYDPPTPPPPRSRWTTWPFLLLFAVIIAVISGLVGGFIGKAITEQRDHPSNAQGTAAPVASSCPSTTSPPADSTRTNETFIALPQTGCDKTPDNNGMTVQSENTKVSYRKYCNVDWPGSDMLAFVAPSLSNCIEACDTWNDNRLRGVNTCAEGDTKECVGAAFVVQWTNTTLAIEEIGKAGNCFLKNEVQGYPPNKRAQNGTEVVGLCLEGKCPSG